MNSKVPIACPHCQARLLLSPERSGQAFVCPQCRKAMQIPELPQTPKDVEVVPMIRHQWNVVDEEKAPLVRKRPRADDRYRMEGEAEERSTSKNKRPKARNAGEPRVYVHQACGSATAVDGTELGMISNPMSACIGTLCVECQEHFPLEDFCWEDTGENIARFRRRHYQRLPGWAFLFGGRKTLIYLLLSFALSGAVGFRFGGWCMAGVVGSLVMFALLAALLTIDAHLHRTYWQVKDAKELV